MIFLNLVFGGYIYNLSITQNNVKDEKVKTCSDDYQSVAVHSE